MYLTINSAQHSEALSKLVTNGAAPNPNSKTIPILKYRVCHLEDSKLNYEYPGPEKMDSPYPEMKTMLSMAQFTAPSTYLCISPLHFIKKYILAAWWQMPIYNPSTEEDETKLHSEFKATGLYSNILSKNLQKQNNTFLP